MCAALPMPQLLTGETPPNATSGGTGAAPNSPLSAFFPTNQHFFGDYGMSLDNAYNDFNAQVARFWSNFFPPSPPTQ